MKKRSIRIIAFVMLFVVAFPIQVFAAPPAVSEPQANAYIHSCSAHASNKGNGKIVVSFTITGTNTMTDIGAKYIYIYDTMYTNPVATYSYRSYPSMMGHNRVGWGSSITHYGTAGHTYYALVAFYGARNGGSGTEFYTTNRT